MGRTKDSLVDKIHGVLVDNGFERTPGTNEFRAPGGDDLPVEDGSNSGIVAADQLRLFIERIERLEEEKRGMADDVKDTYAEAKANGYDTATMRKIVRLRKLEKHARDEQDALLETYRNALGM